MTPAELTAARELLGVSQVALAEVLGIHPTIVNRWERGRAKIPPYLGYALRGIEAASLCATLNEIKDAYRHLSEAPNNDIRGIARAHLFTVLHALDTHNIDNRSAALRHLIESARPG